MIAIRSYKPFVLQACLNLYSTSTMEVESHKGRRAYMCTEMDYNRVQSVGKAIDSMGDKGYLLNTVTIDAAKSCITFTTQSQQPAPQLPSMNFDPPITCRSHHRKNAESTSADIRSSHSCGCWHHLRNSLLARSS